MAVVMTPEEQSKLVKQLATAAGFDLCGVAAARPIPRADYVLDWLASGRAGTMAYLHRYVDRRLDPTQLVPGARSVIVVALNYHQHPPAELTDPETPNASEPNAKGQHADGPRGRVAMYAWGDDYHKVMKKKLFTLADQLRRAVGRPFEAKVCVDTSPLLEREMAAAAGIGWIGKNTLVLNDVIGSYFFLGAIVTTLALAHDEPGEDHCGSCTACLEACPTQAFPAPYEMDASRCISYLTIEHREPIDPACHEAMGDWVFGCDVCQAVCPHNRKAPETAELRFAIREPGPRPRLSELLNWSEDDYRETLRGSAIKRATYDMLRRNAHIAASHASGPGYTVPG